MARGTVPARFDLRWSNRHATAPTLGASLVRSADHLPTSLKHPLNRPVFFTPLAVLLAAVGLSLWQGPAVVAAETTVNDWILGNFSPLFAWAGIGFLALLACIALSPLGGRVIGETGAIPILSRGRWFAVTLCTTIATGILFWGAAEPLFHLNDPPAMLGLEPGSDAAATFAMSTMFLHWTLTPYAIYTVAGLAFALVYYNRREPFSLSSLFVPLIGQRAHGPVGTGIDILCLYALVAGMAASLGAGVLALAGGIEGLGRAPAKDAGRDRGAERHREPAPAREDGRGVRPPDDPPAERRERDAREQREKADPGPGEERREIAENPVVDRGFCREHGRPLPQAEDDGGEKHRERREEYRAIERVFRECWQRVGRSDRMEASSMAAARSEVNSGGTVHRATRSIAGTEILKE